MQGRALSTPKQVADRSGAAAGTATTHRCNWAVAIAIAAGLLTGAARPVAAADAVTEWTMLADRFGRGSANWRTLAIMHAAMHDALNAALPPLR